MWTYLRVTITDVPTIFFSQKVETEGTKEDNNDVENWTWLLIIVMYIIQEEGRQIEASKQIDLYFQLLNTEF